MLPVAFLIDQIVDAPDVGRERLYPALSGKPFTVLAPIGPRLGIALIPIALVVVAVIGAPFESILPLPTASSLAVFPTSTNFTARIAAYLGSICTDELGTALKTKL